MSDRVALIGGSVEGRDHFPFPVPEGDVTSTEYATPASLGQMMLWTFLVKTWQLNGTFTWNSESPTYGHIDFECTFNVAENFVKIYRNFDGDIDYATRESDLVAFGGFVNDPFVVDITNNVSGDHGFLDAYGLSLLDNFGGSDPIVFNAGEFHPFVGFDMLTASGFPEAGHDIEIGMPSGDGSGMDQPSGKFTIDGNEFPVYIISAGEFVNPASVDFDLGLVPQEFWPYAAKDGSPIYDTSTGAQLQSPFN